MDQNNQASKVRQSSSIYITTALEIIQRSEKKSRELSLVVTKLEEALMWFNKIPQDDRP